MLKTEFVGIDETMHPDSLTIAKTITAERANIFFEGSSILKATLIVKKKYKGEIKSDTLIIYTGNRSATCGINFKENKEYVVYTYAQSYLYGFLGGHHERVQGFRKKNTYWTNHCMRTTQQINQEQELLIKYLKRK